MENAIKALYMGIGMLIGVLLLGVLVYMFRSGAGLSESYEIKKATEQTQAFNAQFEAYEHITDQNGESKGYSFNSKGNSASDVISCANLAMDINNKHDFDLQNTVQVIIEMGGSEKYYVHPFGVQKSNKFIKNLSFDSVKATDEAGGTIPANRYIDFYDFLKEYNEVRIVNIESPNYKSTSETIYKYYFDVGANAITYSETTGKVNSITFKMVEIDDDEFYNTEYWKDNG